MLGRGNADDFNQAGVGWSQQDVVQSVKGHIAFQTATPNQITQGLNGMRVQHDGKPWTVGCLYMQGMPVPSMLVRNLDQQRPVIVGVNGQHVVVLWKAEFTRTPTEPQIRSVTIFDPWDGKDKVLPWPATQLSDTWLVWVALEKDRTF